MINANRKIHSIGGGIQWHLTTECPNRCIHCYTYGKSSNEDSNLNLSIDELTAIYYKLCSFENQFGFQFNTFNLTGGDPLYNDLAWKICEILKQDQRSINLLGIPEEVTTRNITFMKKYEIGYYQVSLDGLPLTHNKIRGPNSFERTIESIHRLNDNKIGCHIMFTIHNINLYELASLIRLLYEEDIIAGFSFDFMIGPTNTTDKNIPRMLNREEAINTIKNYHELQKQYNGSSGLRLLDKTMMNEVLSAKQRGFHESNIYMGGCGTGESFAILANGDVFPCRRLPIKIGNLLQDSVESMYIKNKLMIKFRTKESWEECKNCKFYYICRGCPAVSYAFTGNPFAPME